MKLVRKSSFDCYSVPAEGSNMRLLVPPLLVSACFILLHPTCLAEKRAKKSGDIVLGGLFLLHFSESGDQCDKLFHIGLGHVQAMIFAINTINKNATLLPNKTLGYDIRDYCESASRAMRYTYEFVRGVDALATSNATCLSLQGGKSTLSDPVMAVIGPSDSGSSVLVGSLLQVAGIPVISHSATSDELSSPLYRNFFRTAPPDSQQAKAIASVIEHFKWSYIAIVAVDDSYGRYGVSALQREADRRGSFCIAFAEYIPRLGYAHKLRRAVQRLKRQPLTRVVVVWLFGGFAYHFLSEADQRQLHDRTWLLGDALTTEEMTTLSPYSRVLQGSFGFQPLSRKDEPFEAHMRSLTLRSVAASGVPWWQELWEEEYDCATNDNHRGLRKCKFNQTLSQESIRKTSDTYVPYVIDAVYSVAHALHAMYECTNRHDVTCLTHDVTPSNLNAFLRNVSFDGITGKVQFDRFGDPVTFAYEIVNFRWDLTRNLIPSSPVVGKWQDNNLYLNDSRIRWTSDTGVPSSECAAACLAGTFQVRTTSCCWECTRCPTGRVSYHAGATNCSDCPSLKMPNDERTGCVGLEVANPAWSSATSVLLTIAALFGLVVAFLTSAVFVRFRDTPVVRACNRELSALLLTAIHLCFVASLVDLAWPSSDALCRLTAVWRTLLFATAISVLLLKTLKILQAFQFNLVLRGFSSVVHRVRCQSSLVCALISVEILFSLLWLLVDPPRALVEEVRGEYMFYTCLPHASRAGLAFKIIIYAHMFLLALLCAYYAFKARNLPENFNEAKYIGFSMYVFLISSLVYFPVDFGLRVWYLPIMASAATMFCSYGLLGCMFGPKVYVILFCPEKNTQAAVQSQVTSYSFGTSTDHAQVSPINVQVSPPTPAPSHVSRHTVTPTPPTFKRN